MGATAAVDVDGSLADAAAAVADRPGETAVAAETPGLDVAANLAATLPRERGEPTSSHNPVAAGSGG